jgi:flagellar biosynthetic protein FliR
MDLTLPIVLGATLVLLRISALVVTAPVLGSKTIPARLKVVLVFVITWAVYLGAGAPPVAVPPTLGALVGLALSETALGLVAGLSSRLVLDAAQVGGQAAGMSLGFGFGAMLDPHSNAESTAIGELMKTLALGAALALNLHVEAIAWLARSVHDVPPGGVVDTISLASALVRQIVFSLALAIRVGWPLFTASLFAYGVLGLLGRAAPALSLSNVGFAVSVMAGGTALYLVVPEASWLCATAALKVFSRS